MGWSPSSKTSRRNKQKIKTDFLIRAESRRIEKRFTCVDDSVFVRVWVLRSLTWWVKVTGTTVGCHHWSGCQSHSEVEVTKYKYFVTSLKQSFQASALSLMTSYFFLATFAPKYLDFLLLLTLDAGYFCVYKCVKSNSLIIIVV